MIYDWTIIIMY